MPILNGVLLFALALAGVIWAGYRVLREKSPEEIRKIDAKAIRRWARISRRGFWMHLLIAHASLFILFFFLIRPLLQSLKALFRGEVFAFHPEITPTAVILCTGGCLLSAFLDWTASKQNADDALNRAQQADQPALPNNN